MAESPEARTVRHAKKIGLLAAKVSRWVDHGKWAKKGEDAKPTRGGHSVDLFGWIDVVAFDVGIRDDGYCIGIQATSGSNAAARVKKIQDWEHLALWLHSGNRAEVWAWRKTGGAGERKLWRVRRINVQVDSYADLV